MENLKNIFLAATIVLLQMKSPGVNAESVFQAIEDLPKKYLTTCFFAETLPIVHRELRKMSSTYPNHSFSVGEMEFRISRYTDEIVTVGFVLQGESKNEEILSLETGEDFEPIQLESSNAGVKPVHGVFQVWSDGEDCRAGHYFMTNPSYTGEADKSSTQDSLNEFVYLLSKSPMRSDIEVLANPYDDEPITKGDLFRFLMRKMDYHHRTKCFFSQLESTLIRFLGEFERVTTVLEEQNGKSSSWLRLYNISPQKFFVERDILGEGDIKQVDVNFQLITPTWARPAQGEVSISFLVKETEDVCEATRPIVVQNPKGMMNLGPL